MTNTRTLARLLCAAAIATCIGAGHAQTTAQQVRIIVPFATGGSTDALGRAVAQKLAEVLGQAVVVDNRAGGGTVIGTQALQAAPPDGNTLLLTTPDFVVNAFIQPKLPYDPLKDFAPIAVVAQNQLVMTAAASLQARTVPEVLRLARAQPGGLNYASAGIGSTAHLSGELLQMLSGVKLTHVPYKGMGPAMADMLGGRTQLTFVSWITIAQHVEQGKLAAIAVTGPKRLAILPNLPTIAESVPGFDLQVWFGFFAPKGTPPETLNRLHGAIAQVMKMPELRQQLAGLGAELGASTPKEFNDLLVAEYAKWGKVVKAGNIKAE
jgi:tripartite-type tricarboxylate transporter receptor subunit TctC